GRGRRDRDPRRPGGRRPGRHRGLVQAAAGRARARRAAAAVPGAGAVNRLLEAFIRRPVLAVVVSLAIVLLGGRAAQNLPIQQFPRIASAAIVVSTVYVGASAEVVRGFITTPIERVSATVTGVDYVESRSVAGPSSVAVGLELERGANVAVTGGVPPPAQIPSQRPVGGETPARPAERC